MLHPNTIWFKDKKQKVKEIAQQLTVLIEDSSSILGGSQVLATPALQSIQSAFLAFVGICTDKHTHVQTHIYSHRHKYIINPLKYNKRLKDRKKKEKNNRD